MLEVQVTAGACDTFKDIDDHRDFGGGIRWTSLCVADVQPGRRRGDSGLLQLRSKLGFQMSQNKTSTIYHVLGVAKRCYTEFHHRCVSFGDGVRKCRRLAAYD